MKITFTWILRVLCFIGITVLVAASVANKNNQQMIYTQNAEILNNQNNQNKILIQLSKKYPVYEINFSKKSKTKIKKIKELENEIKKLLKEG